jgi:hypothetical protein
MILSLLGKLGSLVELSHNDSQRWIRFSGKPEKKMYSESTFELNIGK